MGYVEENEDVNRCVTFAFKYILQHMYHEKRTNGPADAKLRFWLMSFWPS